MSKILRIDLFIAISILLLVWPGVFPSFANFLFGVALFYFFFRYVIVLLMNKDITIMYKDYLISRYNVFLIIHGFIFLMLSAYIDFDYLGRTEGDWITYDFNARNYAEHLFKDSTYKFSNPFVNINDGGAYLDVMTASGYMTMIGLIYYFFNFSTSLAVLINVFFIVSTSIVLYMLLHNIFNHRIAKYAMYMSAFFPVFFLLELSLWKECIVLFLFVTVSLLTYRILYNKRTIFDIILLVIFSYTLLNVRFYYLLPIVTLFISYYLAINPSFKKFGLVILIIGLIGFYFIEVIGFSGTNVLYKAFYKGFSVVDVQMDINYSFKLSDPLQIIWLAFKYPSRYLFQLPNYLSSPWSLPRIYHIPFLSKTKIWSTEYWPYELLNYSSGVFLWINIFAGLFGFMNMFKNNIKKTAIIWVPLLLLPIVSTFMGGSGRYLEGLTPFVLGTIAIGLANKNRAKSYFVAAYVLSLSLIVIVNRNSFIFPTVIFSLGIMGIIYLYKNLIHPKIRMLNIMKG